MSRNHPSHSFLLENSDDQQTSFEEIVENRQMRESERLLSENPLHSQKPRKQDEEVHQLHRKLAIWEKERIDMLQEIAIYEQKDERVWREFPVDISQQTMERKELVGTSDPGVLVKNTFRINKKNSSSLVPLDQFQQDDSQSWRDSTENLNDRCGSMKTSKLLIELQNELFKTRKERQSFQDQLEQSQIEAKRLRRKLEEEEEYRENVIGIHASHREVMDLKKGFDDSLVELETAAEVMTQQRQTIQDMKKQSDAEKRKCMELYYSLEVGTKNLRIAKNALCRKDAEIKQFDLTVKSLRNQIISKENDLKNLRQIVISWEKRYVDLQNEMKRSERNNLENSLSVVIGMQGKQHIQVLNCGKKESEFWAKPFSGKVQEIDKKGAEHVKDTILNSDLKKKAVKSIERVEELTSVSKELEQISSDESIRNSSLLSLQLQRAKDSENETVISYERKIAALTMNKDDAINALKSDLSAIRSRSHQEAASLANELSELRALNCALERRYSPEVLQQKDQKIFILEQTLHAQEGTLDSLRSELGQNQLNLELVIEQHRKDLDQLAKELLESQSTRMNDSQERAQLKAKLEQCKIEHDREIKNLTKEIERVNTELALSRNVREPQVNTMMQEAKRRLEQLKIVNTELKEDNVNLSSQLELSLNQIQRLETQREANVKMET